MGYGPAYVKLLGDPGAMEKHCEHCFSLVHPPPASLGTADPLQGFNKI